MSVNTLLWILYTINSLIAIIWLKVTSTMDPNIYALVLDTLNRATSQNTEVLKPAEKKLQEWETEPGFYSVLLVSETFLQMIFLIPFCNSQPTYFILFGTVQ